MIINLDKKCYRGLLLMLANCHGKMYIALDIFVASIFLFTLDFDNMGSRRLYISNYVNCVGVMGILMKLVEL